MSDVSEIKIIWFNGTELPVQVTCNGVSLNEPIAPLGHSQTQYVPIEENQKLNIVLVTDDGVTEVSLEIEGPLDKPDRIRQCLPTPEQPCNEVPLLLTGDSEVYNMILQSQAELDGFVIVGTVELHEEGEPVAS